MLIITYFQIKIDIYYLQINVAITLEERSEETVYQKINNGRKLAFHGKESLEVRKGTIT